MVRPSEKKVKGVGPLPPLPPSRKRKASQSPPRLNGNVHQMAAYPAKPNTRRRTGLHSHTIPEDEDEYQGEDQDEEQYNDEEVDNENEEDDEEDVDEDDNEDEAEDGESDVDGKVKKFRKYARTTKTNPNGRQKGRNLVNWAQPKDQQLLIIIWHEIHAAGLDASELWTKVIRRLHNDPNKTGPTIPQHIDKLRQRVFEAGGLVPPWNGRDNCPTVSQQSRGIIKTRKTKKDGRGWRDVTWEEKLEENIDKTFQYNTSESCGVKTVINPGKKSEQSLTEQQKGWSSGRSLFQRKMKSSADVVKNKDGSSLSFVQAGYSVRGKSKTTYAKKGSVKPTVESRVRMPRNQKRVPIKESYESEEESENARMEESEEEDKDADYGYSQHVPRYQGGGKVISDALAKQYTVKPQHLSDEEEEYSDKGSNRGSDGDVAKNNHGGGKKIDPRIADDPRNYGYGDDETIVDEEEERQDDIMVTAHPMDHGRRRQVSRSMGQPLPLSSRQPESRMQFGSSRGSPIPRDFIRGPPLLHQEPVTSMNGLRTNDPLFDHSPLQAPRYGRRGPGSRYDSPYNSYSSSYPSNNSGAYQSSSNVYARNNRPAPVLYQHTFDDSHQLNPHGYTPYHHVADFINPNVGFCGYSSPIISDNGTSMFQGDEYQHSMANRSGYVARSHDQHVGLPAQRPTFNTGQGRGATPPTSGKGGFALNNDGSRFLPGQRPSFDTPQFRRPTGGKGGFTTNDDGSISFVNVFPSSQAADENAENLPMAQNMHDKEGASYPVPSISPNLGFINVEESQSRQDMEEEFVDFREPQAMAQGLNASEPQTMAEKSLPEYPDNESEESDNGDNELFHDHTPEGTARYNAALKKRIEEEAVKTEAESQMKTKDYDDYNI